MRPAPPHREQARLVVGRHRLPNGALLSRDAGALLGGAPGRLGGLGGEAGLLRSWELGTQAIQLVPQRCRRIRRCTRRLERAGAEAAVAEGPVEPDSELARDLERRQCRAVVAAVPVYGLVPNAAQVMEKVDHVAREGRLPP